MEEEGNVQQIIVKEEVSFLGPFGRVLAIEVFLFASTLLLGICTAFQANKILSTQNVEIPEISFWQFIFHFILTTLFVFLIIQLVRFKKKRGFIFKVFFVAATFLGGVSLISVWLGDIAALLLMLCLTVWWWFRPSILVQDLCIIFGIAGAGSLLGLAFQPEIVVLLLVVFSIYDVVAVYKTKHMVEMAKEMIKSKAVLGLIIPRDVSGFTSRLETIKPGGKFLILGGGDIVFPLFLCCSLIPSAGLVKSLIVAVFSSIGLLASFYLFAFQKKRKPIPALPPIALFSIMGYLAIRFIL